MIPFTLRLLFYKKEEVFFPTKKTFSLPFKGQSWNKGLIKSQESYLLAVEPDLIANDLTTGSSSLRECPLQGEHCLYDTFVSEKANYSLLLPAWESREACPVRGRTHTRARMHARMCTRFSCPINWLLRRHWLSCHSQAVSLAQHFSTRIDFALSRRVVISEDVFGC